jgi:two-component system, LytTR family, response regulator
LIRVVIIEDEQVAFQLLKKIIETNFPELEIVGNADSCNTGIELIKSVKPDIVFLDIQMHDGSGFTLLEAFDNIDFGIIFVTSFDKYAINAIKFSALDYILKPVKPDDLRDAIKRYKKSNNIAESTVRHSALLENIKTPKKHPQKIVLPTNEEYFIVSPDDIIRCQSDNYYTNIFLTNGKTVLVSKTLKEYENLLADSGFLRTHNSHLINVKYIRTFVRLEGGYIVMTDNKIIPVSRRKKGIVIDLINNM